MKRTNSEYSRRQFVKNTTLIATGLIGLSGFNHSLANDFTPKESLFVIGPVEGYSSHIGTIVSMLNYNRQTVIDDVKSLTIDQLDYLFDSKANTIAALILHLGAAEKFYQINSFEGRQDFSDEEKKFWSSPMDLGDAGRRNIKGQGVKYYLDIINKVRQKTLEEFKKRDDKWLLAIDPEWSKERPLNTYWKWFHVCEHESNHRGQITWLKRRLPGAKDSKD